MDYLILLIIALIAYLLGSINSSIIIANLFFKKDIRNLGSGNAGMTNVLRNFGIVPAIITTVVDFGKSLLAVYIAMLLMPTTSLLPSYGMYLAALMSVVGHMFPVYFKFKGGKGVLTTAGAVLLIHPYMLLIAIAIFILIVFLTRYVSLGSVLCCSSFPITLTIHLYVEQGGFSNFSFDLWYEILMSVAIVALVIIKHRGNISRLIQGCERKLSIKKKMKIIEEKTAELKEELANTDTEKIDN